LVKHRKLWTKEEIQYLIKNYSREDMEKMVKFLGRTETAIKIRAHKLKLKRLRGNGIFKRIMNKQKKLRKNKIHD
jgi:hypothetical protein